MYKWIKVQKAGAVSLIDADLSGVESKETVKR
jgi:hypothetical protein